MRSPSEAIESFYIKKVNIHLMLCYVETCLLSVSRPPRMFNGVDVPLTENNSKAVLELNVASSAPATVPTARIELDWLAGLQHVVAVLSILVPLLII